MSFNPTLVRLRRLGVPVTICSNQGFQSHAGSIEAQERGRMQVVNLLFQCHAGSIEAPGRGEGSS